ncbi:alpha-hydroxy-acid oxidizing protein [Pseudolabrys taiwanensis]|uniref:Alpha-hydroxy-acid oxidizing protein n=1 Tax=Pseudolabrys taiwanensis TaxID=331696 RepID=A0A345ZTJ2_9HYPH|nr:alpha-hydroxy acid oxidase [Pseudolabrys taiwanensis]AXK80239.1 alpha-hydroxy-acid oxidizing protein [Pseudolabrys taiwanensis]
MHDMTAKKEAAFVAAGPHPNFAKWHKLFPTTAWLREQAPRNVPRFSFEYGDTGAGNDIGIAHNWAAFDNIKIVPRYGVTNTLPPVDVDLFGTRYAAPVGIAPMGGPALVWPGADLLMAKAAQRVRIPYTLGVAGGATIEEIARVAPDVFWLQLYRFYRNEHAIGLDLVRRAHDAGVKVLTLTLDVPVRTTRSRETYAGLANEFKPNARMIREMLVRPKWLMALLRNGYPRFATIGPYANSTKTNEIIRFARQNMGGAFNWDEVARYRDAWKGPMTVKGILHPHDAEKAVSLGVDGIWISNHGGRQIEALVPSIDALPGIVAAVGKKATILLDSGVRSGQDVLRAVALGADCAFAGKSFLWAVAALGDEGAEQLVDLYIDELRASLGQIGALSLAEAREATILHPGAIKF